MAALEPAKRPCKHADQCTRRDCFFGHPSGDLCPAFPQPCRNFAQCRSRHPPPTAEAAAGTSSSPPRSPEREPCRGGDACARADCRFYHPGGLLCRHYQRCEPRSGITCTFRHPPISQDARAAVLPVKAIRQPKAKIGASDAAQPPRPATTAGKSPFKPKDSSPPRSAVKNEAKTARSSPQKPNSNGKLFPEEKVKRALEHHERIIQIEEDKFRQAVAESAAHAFSGVDSTDELTRRALRAKMEELLDQRDVFVELSSRILTDDGPDGAPVLDPARSSLLNRELFRFKSRLPALAKRIEIERHLSSSASRFTVIQGQTGSGKSTQIPQYAADLPAFADKKIICTQPRKIAATSLAARVAFEYSGGSKQAAPGGAVGFRVGGHVKSSKHTRIEYVTEGVLLDMITRACGGVDEKLFDDVGCIIIDEAHERSITCDLIMGSLKEPHDAWRHVKVVITSATIDLDLFSGFFDNAPVVMIPGRMFPVDVEYVQAEVGDASTIAAAVSKMAFKIHETCQSSSDGDILCFLPGQDDVLRAKDLFEARLAKTSTASGSGGLPGRIQVHALFGKQDSAEQALVFEKQPDVRKVIFSTDVAETSVTIEGVVFVVDSGLCKKMVYDPVRNMSALKVHTISRSSAVQRCGRAGRTRPGRCFRLYSQRDFEEMEIGNAAEIFQQPLSLALLSLYHVGIAPQDFHWIEAPSADAIDRAQAELLYLGAIDSSGSVTTLGRLVDEVQMDPKVVRLIDRSASEGLAHVGVDLAALLSVANIAYYRGNKNDKTSKADADAKREQLLIPDQGDVVSLYRTYLAWKTELEGGGEDGDATKEGLLAEDLLGNDNDNEDEETAPGVPSRPKSLARDAATRPPSFAAAEEEIDGEESSHVEVDGEPIDTAPTSRKKPGRKRNEKKARAWCLKNGVNSKAMGIAYATAKEMIKTLSRARSWAHGTTNRHSTASATNEQLRRLMTAGFFLNAAVNKPASAAAPRWFAPQYYALYSGTLGSVFKGSSMHLVEKNGAAIPSWVLFDSILRLSSTTFLSLATPIDESWIKHESPVFYELCLQNRSELPVETIEFASLSRPLLKSLFGKSFDQLNRWEAQLKCTMSVDQAAGTLTVHCAPVHARQVRLTLGDRIDSLKKRMVAGTTEEVYMGSTRAVLGSGFVVHELLFDKEFSAIVARNLPDVSDREVEQRIVQWTTRAGCSAASIRVVDVLRHNSGATTSVSATIKLFSKEAAHKIYDTMRGDSSGGSGDTIHVAPLRVLKDQSKASASAELAGRIKLTWADGEATGDAKVFFRTALDANTFVRNAQHILALTVTRAFAVGSASDQSKSTESAALPAIGRVGARTPPKPATASSAASSSTATCPPAPTTRESTGSGDAYWVVFDTEAIGSMPLNEQARMKFCVHLKGGLPSSMDEMELLDRIRPTIPNVVYAKIVRKPATVSTRRTEATELEVRFQRMLPLLTCLDETAVHTDFVDPGTRRAGVVVFCRDLAQLAETYQLASDSPLWAELEKPHGQPIRMEMEHSYTASLHVDMRRCFRDQIAQVIVYARARLVRCDESEPKTLGPASKNMATLKFLGDLAVLRRVKAKLEECTASQKVDGSDVHLLFSLTARTTITWWMNKHYEEVNPRERYFIRWIRNRGEFWVYGDEAGRAYATDRLLKLASDIKALQVLDRPVRLNVNKNQRGSVRQWLSKAPTARALFRYTVQSDRRLIVSGSEEQVAALEAALDADGLLFKLRKRNAKTQEAARPDCGICFTSVEDPFVELTACNHAVCIECIQPMLSSATLDLPALCPTCSAPLHVDDLPKLMSDPDAIASIVETAVFNYTASRVDIAMICPKPGCNQILSASSVSGTGDAASGGRCVYCDQCQETYCLDCSEAAGGPPVPRHAKQTCEDFRAQQVSQKITPHLRFIQDQILNLTCPHCRAVFLDFSGCTSVQCGNSSCGYSFCASCLAYSSTSSGDTHSHVQRCPSNPNPATGGLKGYYVTDAQLAVIHRGLRTRKLGDYFREKLADEATRRVVYKHIARDLHDLGIDIRAQFPGIDTFTGGNEMQETPQEAIVRRHAAHVRDRLLNMRCPNCELVFVDFDFDTCAALTCANPRCKGGFCAYCLENCVGDAHQHVSKCAMNPNKPYFYVTEEQFRLVHKERREKLISSYIHDVVMPKDGAEVAKCVHATLVDDFRSIGVEVLAP